MIHQNIRELRRISGMTQQEVADQVGVTRQAISSYEAGRTQPDLEMLERLAQVYHTDLLSVLYGSSREQRTRRVLKRVFGATLAGTWLLVLAASCLLLVLNRYFSFPSGMAEESFRTAVEFRFSLLELCSFLQGAAVAVAWAGCLMTGVLFSLLPSPLHPKNWIPACLLYFTGPFFCSVPLGLLDPVYTLPDYLLIAAGVTPPGLLLFVYILVFSQVQAFRTHKKSL